MSSPEDITDAEPPSIDPYEVLSLERTATPDQIRSAYRKAALKNHPDKVAPDQRDEAHIAFQGIAFAYAILSDPARRARYDATGSTSESVDADDFNWSAYYRDLFADAISPDAIARFAESYRLSQEERDDVLAAYVESEGDMDGVYASVMLSDVLEDDERFRQIIDEAVEAGEVESYDAYAKETKRKRKDRLRAAKAEAAEAEDYAKELGVHDKLFGDGTGGGSGAKGRNGKKKKDNSEDALAALIKKNQQTREGFLDQLEAKYGAQDKGKKGRKRQVEEEPSEEAFQAAAARLRKGKPESKADSSGSSRKKTRR